MEALDRGSIGVVPLDGQRGIFQQTESANQCPDGLCSGIRGEVWSSECQSTGQTGRKKAVSLGPWSFVYRNARRGRGCPRFSWQVGPLHPAPSFISGVGLVGAVPTVLTCLCPSQATYVLLALAWVFVPIYISSEVSLLLGPQGGLIWFWALVQVGGAQDSLASFTSQCTLRA